MRRLATCLSLIVLAGCGPRTPRHVPIDATLAALVPSDATMLAGMRVAELLETPPVDEMLLRNALPESIRDVADRTRLDPTEDIWELLYISNGVDAVTLAKGRFAELDLKALEGDGKERRQYGGHTLVGDDRHAALLLNASTLAQGSPRLLKSMIDNPAGGSGIPPALMDRIAEVDVGSQVWAVSIGGAPAGDRPVGNLGNMLQLLDKVDGFTLSAGFQSGLRLYVKGECANPEDAESLHSAVRALLVMAQLGTRGRPGTAALLDRIGVLRTDSSIELTADLAPELLHEVLNEFYAGPQP